MPSPPSSCGGTLDGQNTPRHTSRAPSNWTPEQSSQAFRAHQCELVPLQLPGPEGFGAVPIHQGLLAPDLVLRLPGGETLRAEKTANVIRPFITDPVSFGDT